MHTVTYSNYSDLNKTVALRTGGQWKKGWYFANSHTNCRVICQFRMYSLFILVMCIPLERISNPRDSVKYISGKMSLRRKEWIAWNSLLRGKIKRVPSRAHVCSLEQSATNAHDQNEQTSQNISLLGKSKNLSLVPRVDYENKTQILLNPSIQFFIDKLEVGITLSKGEMKSDCLSMNTIGLA